eukprot:GGOE01003216.1.p1 GENE.GGOE01003216.1~~GGOE01003216.1.p1  ORF type:complete len:501 (-),score=137.32 GGOE01003216.1:224-1726(-)
MRLLASNEVTEEAKAVFIQADNDQPCQFVKIAGPTRSGKSTFANALLGDFSFETSNSAEPCTQGIDFCGLKPFVPIAQRLGLEGTPGMISILDIEGGGDRSVQYDVQNLMPAFMLPGVVVWNVLGHPPRTQLLDQLAIISRVGSQLVPRSEAAAGPTFPNDLVLVIRDYTLTSTAEQILSRLLEVEPEVDGRAEPALESVGRNAVRRALQGAFLSIRVHVLPVRSDSEYRAAERALMRDLVALAAANQTKMTPQMCLDFLCDITRQIEANPHAINVGSTLAYINLCEYNRRLRSAEDQLSAMFGEWYLASQYITTVAEAEAKFEKLAEQCWRVNMPASLPVTSGEGLGDTAEERRERFLLLQHRALLQPCVAELKLLEAERTITQMELTACGSRRCGDRLRHCEKAAIERATIIRAELLEKGPQPRFLLAALGNPASFEDFYHDNGLDTLVNAYTREFRHVEAEGVAIADVFEVEDLLHSILTTKLGDVITVEDVLTNIL